MKTAKVFTHKTVLSYEVFPPRKTSPLKTIYTTLDALKELDPDFISVTYGGGAQNTGETTVQIASDIQNKYNINSVAHVTCINNTKKDLLRIIAQLQENNIKNILALRGDRDPKHACAKDFMYASDLISFIKQNDDFNIIAACYPEGHIESNSMVSDIKNLKLKVESGVDQLITQLFFDNDYFYSFVEKTQCAEINVPIQAGIMPVINKKQIEKMVTLCGVSLPKKFLTIMNKYGDKPESMRDAGIAYAIDQIVDLLSQGVDGIHLYTMNNGYVAKKIHSAIKNLI